MKWIVAVVIGFFLLVAGISLFLAPDGLMRCGDSPSDVDGCQAADAIVAVSGGDTPARTQLAIDLYQNGWAPRLIFSGAAQDKSGPSNAEVMREQAIHQGVPKDDIIVEGRSANTSENAENTINILTDAKVNDAIVVTSSYHMKRTILEFRNQAPEIVFRAHPTTSDNQWSVWWWTTPGGWYLAMSEVIKISIVYLGGVL